MVDDGVRFSHQDLKMIVRKCPSGFGLGSLSEVLIEAIIANQ